MTFPIAAIPSLSWVLLSAGAAPGSPPGPHAEAATQSFWDYLVHSNVINIVLVALLLGYLVKRFNLLKGFSDRRLRIAQELETVEARHREALKQLETVQKQTENLSVEVEAILNQARASAESLSAQIFADARIASDKIVEAARRRVEVEHKAAAQDLERRLLQEAIDEARGDLDRRSVDDKRHSVEAFIAELPGIPIKQEP